MSVVEGRPEPADESESDVFEIVLPITVVVLSDEDFVAHDAEEQEVLDFEVREEDEQESVLRSDVTPSNGSYSLSVCEEKKAASKKDNSVNYSEGKWFAEKVCDRSKSSPSGWCGAGTDESSQNYVLPMSSCKTEPAEINETADRRECDSDGGFQKVPSLLFSAGNEGRDETIETTRQVTLAVISSHEEQLVNAAGVLSDDSQEKQAEIHKEMETIVEMEDLDSSKNGDNEANNRKRKRSNFKDETLSSLLEHGLKEERRFTYNCSATLLVGCSPPSKELVEDVGKLEMNTSTSAESNTTGEHIYKTLTPFSKTRYWQQKVVSPHASPKEYQSQQEGLAGLSNSVTITPLSKASCSINKHERFNLKCRFCSSVYKCSALLRKHLYSAHKDKKIHKCCFCKRTFLFSVNLKNHLKFHKNVMRLQRARKNRMNVRKVGQKSEERKPEPKKKESKYEKFFVQVEREFTPLGVPVSFSCKICFFASSNPRTFIRHVKGHKERPPYQCPQCDSSCPSLPYLLNHMYWHAGYKLYQCRFCPFFSLYFGSMVRHSYVHTGARPYSCEFCQSAFTSTSALKRHRRLHAGNETCQGQQRDFLSERKRTQRPLKSYTCDECDIIFYTRKHFGFHKKFHEQMKASANGFTTQSNEYHESKIGRVDSDPQNHGSLSLSGKKSDCLSGGMQASEVDFEWAGNVQNKTPSGKKLSENSHGSNSLSIIGNRSEVPLNSYKMDTGSCKGKPLLNSKASHSQARGDDVYHKFVENFQDMWPPNLCAFKTYKCEQCNYATAVHSDFKLHLKIHTDEKPFACKECNKTFKTSNCLQRHRLHVKNGCEFGRCLRVDSCLENLEFCSEMHVGTCPERDFGSSEGADSFRSLLGSEVCEMQPDIQRGKESDLLAPSQPRFYQCAECEYSTSVLSNLEVHVRTHTGEKPYSCSVCQKKFRTSSHLKRHRITHVNMEHLKCRNCDYSTSKWLSFKQHLASHSCGESSSSDCLYEKKQLPVKTYTCEECGYCTAHNGNLKPHLRIHTGEKPFKCSQCAVAFRTSSHLKRHLLTHLKLRCRRCKFSTADKHAFQKHVKTHKKEYKCIKCNVTLPTKKLLEKHKRQHKVGI
ncbi:uncharacterized protein FYW35_004292 [Pterocles gutturalis]